MDIIEKLLCHEEWLAFLSYKLEGGHLGKADEKELTDFVNNREYISAAERLSSGGFFSVPEVVRVNKSSSDRKRTVFTFPKDENYLQKFIAYQLLGYDYLFASNLYSFRRDMGVKKAIIRLVNAEGISDMYSYKLDISDYFNSVSPQKFLPLLKSALTDNKRLYAIIENMLLSPFGIVEGEQQEVRKGIMAGSPVSGFMANLYLTELDRYFEEKGVLYARYSDDIIVFAESESELQKHIGVILKTLDGKGLEVNAKKIFTSLPREEWTFLGFSYKNGVIDISDVSKMKLKKKMRRKARALLRWKNRKNAEADRAVRAFIKFVNRKLYLNTNQNEITWCRWYFPIITTDEGLREIDEYTQRCIRYIATGKQNKSQYSYRYEQMKALGYTTLVNNYYKFKGGTYSPNN